jgi:glycosyltransferase involved in cell wall biosynthesis
MRTLLAFPSTASFAQQAALAFHEQGLLAAYFTAFVYEGDSALAKLLAVVPALRKRMEPQLRRRLVTELPREVIEQRPHLEILRTIADKTGAGAVTVDRIWDYLSHDFTKAAGRRLGHGKVEAVYAYEYTALEAFKAAERLGIARILDFPSLNSRQFEELQRREKSRYPELRGKFDSYFDARFEGRQARRDSEMAAADVIITNSSVTRQSHILGGASPEKTFAVPYGAPPTVDTLRPGQIARPLKAIWAGTFSIRKGAHYLVEAWRGLGVSTDAELDVFGAVTLPDRLWKPVPSGMTFHGSVTRPELFAAFDAADVLVFPTLSDGFGMVVTEAFSRGVPVITTDQAGASDLVRHGKNGFIIPAGDPDAISEAVRWCLNNRETLDGMRQSALETAKGWQWSDYRRALVAAVETGLSRCEAGRPQALKSSG